MPAMLQDLLRIEGDDDFQLIGTLSGPASCDL